ncbi:unnamed protein product [Allacma fusca]|uniref:Ig-like domain-containing protein n=1 Tax=Allacma fusca TaxID=39272 RepID=A0A8J2L8S5_9HEXA|nr:unnamed protein product [Allacma fusca]
MYLSRVDRLFGVICGLHQIWIVLTSVVSGYTAFEPRFIGSLKNVTVIQGKDASFTCMVDNLGGHRIAWIKVDTKAILAIHDHVITNNARLSVTMNDKVTWTLHIRGALRSDRGYYMCQINTEPMAKQMAFLEVVIPPDITSEETSGDLMVPEGGTAKLICRAKGQPKPVITWRKEDGNHIIIKEGQGGKRKVFPQIQVPNQLIAAASGLDILLECVAEASPKAINYWMRESAEMIIANDKFNMSEEPISQYGVRMHLLIRNLTVRDFSGYKCISQNSMGNAEGTIHIHEINLSSPEKGPLSNAQGERSSLPADPQYSESGEDALVQQREHSTRVPYIVPPPFQQPADVINRANDLATLCVFFSSFIFLLLVLLTSTLSSPQL